MLLALSTLAFHSFVVTWDVCVRRTASGSSMGGFRLAPPEEVGYRSCLLFGGGFCLRSLWGTRSSRDIPLLFLPRRSGPRGGTARW